jgi:deazaflavin-dependent oxidoreductase (nitroreductase family)
MPLPYSDDQLRAMYAGGKGDATARRFARIWAFVFRSGLFPRRWVTLEVRGRTTGRPRRYPLGMADFHEEWYLVSMLGECGWVRNVRGANGRVRLLRLRARSCQLTEIPPDQRAEVLQRYVEKVPGGRPHIPVARGRPLGDFAAIADNYPIFRVQYL